MNELINTNDIFLLDRFVSFVDRSDKTTQTYITNLRQFFAWLRYEDIRQPERTDIIRYRDYLSAEHDAIQLTSDGWSYRTDRNGRRIRTQCRPSTTAQYMRSVCQFFRWTASEGLYPNIADNIHTPKVRHNTHRKEALTAADVLTIERSISTEDEKGKRLLAMFLLAVNSGLRTIELERANIKDLEVIHGNAYLYIHGKGQRGRYTQTTSKGSVQGS